MTGCTLGKGNLEFHDHGKHVYTFVRRSDGQAIRVVIRPEYWGERSPEHEAVSAAMRAGTATPEQRARFLELQEARARELLETPEETLIDVRPVEASLARKARVADYVLCGSCRELTLKTHLRRHAGQDLCLPCFNRAGGQA